MAAKLSLVVPCYNEENTLAGIVERVLALRSEKLELEIIIVDDCSTDDTDSVVERFLSDERIRYLKNEKNSGAAISRNYALREAKGKWIAFLDSDDLWLPKKLETQIAFMVENNYKFSCTDYRIRQNGILLPYACISPNIVTRRKLFNYCYIATLTVMYDREFVGLVQIENLRKNNDYAMWFEVAKKAPCHRLPLRLSYYCRHNGSLSSGNKLKLIKHHYILYRKGLHKGRLLSVLLTVNNLLWGVHKKLFYKEKVEI